MVSSTIEDDIDFASVGVGDFLEFDPRPTLVVYEDFDQDLEPAFLNKGKQSSRSYFVGIFNQLTLSP